MIALAAAIVLAIQLQAPKTGRLGMQLNVTSKGGVPELLQSAKETRDLGCTALPFSVKWSELETTPGHYDLDKLKNDFAWREKLGFVTYLTLQTIDTNQRTLPADLMKEPWDSAKMIRREHDLLGAIVKALPKDLGAFLLGNEVDGYLIAHRDETAPYLTFLRQGREFLHRQTPGLRVGVTTMFSNLAAEPGLIKSLHGGMDLVSMTYYPMNGFQPRSTTMIGVDFDSMLALAGKRRLFIQEAGLPASPVVGSSEDIQADFVARVFDAMQAHRDRLEAVCFFLLVDFNDQLLDQLVAYYGVNAEQFRAFLGSLGFKTQDGTPRRSWKVFQERAKEYESAKTPILQP